MPNKTEAKPRDRFASTLQLHIELSDKTQVQIAEDIGYDNPNMITMFKQGKTRVPLIKVVPLARSLGADPAEFLHEWMDAYMPGILATLEPLIGMPLTANEIAWVQRLRKLFGRVPPFRSAWENGLKEMVDPEEH
jgi:hypothetical protein